MVSFMEWVASFALSLDQYIVRLIVAILIVLVGFIIGRMAGKIIRTAFHQAQIHDIISDSGKFSLDELIGSAVSYAIYIASIIIALSELDFSKEALLTLVVILLFSFMMMMIWCRHFTLNLLGGFYIYFRERLLEGMSVKIGKTRGRIQEIGLLETIIIDAKGKQTSIPNAKLFTEPVIIERQILKKRIP